MRAILFAAVVVGIASAADHKFAIGEPASCVVDASGRTIVRYISEVHTSFQCTHTSAGACTCTGQHPTHHKGNCRTFAHLGRVHQVGGDCSGLATAITTTEPHRSAGMQDRSWWPVQPGWRTVCSTGINT